jgi:hypothetical protein
MILVLVASSLGPESLVAFLSSFLGPMVSMTNWISLDLIIPDVYDSSFWQFPF